MAIYGTLGEVNLTALSASISDTAVDIFVYDTSKDSDGGAWRKRTQHTSWYNETLNTATRGSRREFPAVAVLVMEYEKLTIYDGDDPDLPMWMKFEYGNINLPNMKMLYSNGTAVTALNGIVCCTGTASWHDGLTEINFIQDFSRFRNSSNITDWTGGIGTRNIIGGYKYFYNISSMYIVSSNVNDVAMTVLPNAPIDETTGLPIPTIAVATDGGVSVIKDDGTVVDWTESTGPDSTHRVSFRNDGKLGVFTSGTSGINNYPQAYYITIPSTDVSASFYYNFNSLGIEKYGYENETNSSARLAMKGNLNAQLVDLVDSSDRTYAATNAALNIISRPESVGTTADMTTGMIDFVTSSYNTGWMHGDIKGAFLSDTDATNVTGSEKISNYDFVHNLLKDNGVKSKIIEKYLPLINQSVSKYLQMMDFYINFSLDEEFNETILSPIHEDFSYSSFSEGEKQRIDLALLFTWREVAKIKNSTNTNLLIMDEIFDSSLDGFGTEDFLKIIKFVVKDANVFVISHKESLHDRFEKVVKFEKRKNFSQIVEL